MRAAFGHGGWVGVDGVDLPGPLYVRVRADESGRLRVSELYLDGSQSGTPLTGADLRDLPLGRIEALINAHADQVERRARYLSPDLSTYATFFNTGFGRYDRLIEDRHWVAISFANQVPDQDLKDLPSFVRVERKERAWQGIRDDEDGPNFRLSPGGPTAGLTDEFLADVARAYADAVARGERPNVALAEQTGSPVKTVQRWVYTARQRGVMPRGSRGRPG